MMPNSTNSIEYWRRARAGYTTPPPSSSKQHVEKKFEVNNKFKIALVVVAIIVILMIIDFFVFFGRVYPGVKVGDVDLGFKTIEEANSLIEDTYSPRLYRNTVVVYVDEEAQAKGVNDTEGSSLNEQLSVEQAKKTARYWKIMATDLDAKLPSEELAFEAVNSTRGPLNIFNRLGAAIFGKTIPIYATYNYDTLENTVHKINDTMGTVVVNPIVKVENANAEAVDGSDGEQLDKDEFNNQLNTAFFKENSNDSNFVAKLHPAYQQVSYQNAEELAQKINNSLSKPVEFNYNNKTWQVSASDIGSWISVEIENRPNENAGGCSCSRNTDNYCLCAKIKQNDASRAILSHAKGQLNNNKDINISFEKDKNNILVKPSDTFEIPAVGETINTLNNDWLKNPVSYKNNNDGKNSGCSPNDTEKVSIKIANTTVSNSLSFDEAMALGIIGEISSYTTTYASGAGTENRNYNIALVSSMLNNSICKAQGQTWSFNEVAGECNEEKGFKEAGAVFGSTYTQEAGGGICQVATTIFNAVYDSGFPIPIRTPHHLYIASYPAGRDAAISYPNPDLVWRNDSNSDVLVKVEATGYSVVCTLYGVSPNYKVESEVGEWVPGDPYETEVVIDPSKPAHTSYIQTSGADGRSIVVKRKVYDKDGQLLRTDEFRSVYAPKTEIKVIGPGQEADQLLAAKKARLKNDKDNW